jgi:hypothetical protein
VFSHCNPILLNAHRVALPYEGIQQLTDNPIKAFLNVGIFTKNADKRQILLTELNKKFKNHGKSNENP